MTKYKIGDLVYGTSRNYEESMYAADDYYIGVVIAKKPIETLSIHSEYYQNHYPEAYDADFEADMHKLLSCVNKKERKKMIKHYCNKYHGIIDDVNKKSDIRHLVPTFQGVTEAFNQMFLISKNNKPSTTPEAVYRIVKAKITFENLPSNSPL